MQEINDLLDKICGDNYTTEWNKLNYLKIPFTPILAEYGNEKDFNKLYNLLCANEEFVPLERTKSGGICIDKRRRLYYHHVFDVRVTGAGIEMTVCTLRDTEMRSYRISYQNNNYTNENGERAHVSGRSAYLTFIGEIKKDELDLRDYAISAEEGLKAKHDIHRPDIRLMSDLWLNGARTFNHAYHLDFHKAYMSGLKIAYPEFAPAIDRIAERAKTNKKYKTAMAACIGYLQSKCCGFKYSHLAKAAINTFYKRYDEVLEKLSKERLVLATNTDGIWYVGPEWHGPYEGEGLTFWSTDHKDCTINFKSAGSYQFIEDGVYHPVVRGKTKLDNIKPRSEWVWDDIFNPEAELYYCEFKEGEGIVWQLM